MNYVFNTSIRRPLLALFAVLAFASTALAATDSDVDLGTKMSANRIKWMQVEPNGSIRVRLWNGTSDMDHCSQTGSQSYAYISANLNQRAADNIYRTMLSAMLAGKQVEIYTLWYGTTPECYIKGVVIPE